MKIRKIKHRTKKYFGEYNEKWAKGGGSTGYGRMYGKNKHGNEIDYRTIAERKDRDERKLLELEIKDDNF